MRTLALLLISMCPAFALDPVVSVSLYRTSQLNATAVSNVVKNRLRNGDSITIEEALAIDEGGQTVYQYVISVTFANRARALSVYGDAVGFGLPAGSRVVFHMHPFDGEVSQWRGCDEDPAAEFQEARF